MIKVISSLYTIYDVLLIILYKYLYTVFNLRLLLFMTSINIFDFDSTESPKSFIN